MRSPLSRRLLHGAALAATVAASAGITPAACAQPATAALIDAVEPRVIAWRRHLHENAELSYQEVKTSAYIAEALRAMPGITAQTGLAKTGVKALVEVSMAYLAQEGAKR